MLTIIPSIDENSFNPPADSPAYLPADHHVFFSTGHAVEFYKATNASVYLDGQVGSVANGVFVGDDCTSALIQVGTTGRVFGLNGIDVKADSARIENYGLIGSTTYNKAGSGISFEPQATKASLFNDGRITGVDGVLSLTASLHMTNTGKIVGTGNGVHVLKGHVWIDNHGTISGATGILSKDGLVTLTNDGTISASGGVALHLSATAHIVNSGTIGGQVTLSGKADYLDSSRGHIAGPILAGAGNDTIMGSADGDTIRGDAGNDRLTGFGGDDHFVFTSALSAKTNVDTIVDFTHGHDVIELGGKIFKGIGAALDSGEFYAAKGATKAHDSSDRIIYDTASGKLYYDSDGNKANGHAAIEFAVLANHASSLANHQVITADDFLIV
jgi:Ca2+-binding RTX toxin-like protein